MWGMDYCQCWEIMFILMVMWNTCLKLTFRQGFQWLPAQCGQRQEQGTAGPCLSPAIPGHVISPLYHPGNCSILRSAARSDFGSCWIQPQTTVSRCEQKGWWSVHKGMLMMSIPCPAQGEGKLFNFPTFCTKGWTQSQEKCLFIQIHK